MKQDDSDPQSARLFAAASYKRWETGCARDWLSNTQIRIEEASAGHKGHASDHPLHKERKLESRKPLHPLIRTSFGDRSSLPAPSAAQPRSSQDHRPLDRCAVETAVAHLWIRQEREYGVDEDLVAQTVLKLSSMSDGPSPKQVGYEIKSKSTGCSGTHSQRRSTRQARDNLLLSEKVSSSQEPREGQALRRETSAAVRTSEQTSDRKTTRDHQYLILREGAKGDTPVFQGETEPLQTISRRRSQQQPTVN